MQGSKLWIAPVGFCLAVVGCIAVVAILRNDERSSRREAPIVREDILPSESISSAKADGSEMKRMEAPMRSSRPANDKAASPEDPAIPTLPSIDPDPRDPPSMTIEALVDCLRKATEEKDLEALKRVIEELKKRKESAVHMVALLQTSDTPIVRRMAVAVMDDILARQLGDNDDGWYGNSHLMLEKVRDPQNLPLIQTLRGQMVPALIHALENDPDVLTRRWSASALGQLGGLQAAEALAKAIRADRQEFGIASWAESALSVIWDREAFPLMSGLAKDKTFPFDGRTSAIRSLSFIDSPNSFETLEELSADAGLRLSVIAALQYMEGPHVKRLLERLNEEERALTVTRSELTVVPPENPNEAAEAQTRERVEKEMGKRLDGLNVDSRIVLLGNYLFPDSDPVYKEIALRLIGKHEENSSAIAAVERVARGDSNVRLRSMAVSVLGEIGKAETAKLLDEIEKDWARLLDTPAPKEVFDEAREAIYRRTVMKE